jgi:hypothetical protein
MDHGKSRPFVFVTLVTFGVGQIVPYFSEDRPHGDPLQLFHQPHTHQDPPPGSPDRAGSDLITTSTATGTSARASLEDLLKVYMFDPSA